MRLALWAAVAFCAAVIFWVANGVAPWDGDKGNAWHQYEYLADGFLSGHTYLSVQPAPELLRLKDPYDPAANGPYRLWDTSLYNGKFYLYQGPVPALVLMAPLKALTGHMLPQRLAVAVFAAAGLAALGLLLLEIRNRHFPGLSALGLAAVVLVAFHASWLPVTLRRPALWELPVVAAAACLWWALYFLWKFHDSGGKARWGAATGLALALLLGSRVASLFGAGSIALLLFLPPGTGGKGGRRWGPALLAGAVASAGGLALLAYNHARFGSWTDFGLRYCLFGEDYRGIKYSNIGFIPFNLWVYLFSAPQLGPYFPFLHPFWSDNRPAGFIGFEEMYGVGFMLPVHLAGLAAIAWAWSNRTAAGARAALLTLAGAALATAAAGLILFSWAWACSRFITELMAGWTVVSAVGLMAVFGSAARASRLVRVLAAAAACWSIACSWLASAEFRGYMRQTNPLVYSAAAHALDYPSLWWAKAHHVDYGPVDLSLHIDPLGPARTTVIMASGRPQNENQLKIAQDGDGRARILLVENERTVLETPSFPVRSDTLRLHIEAPWLYPPAEHPYWDSVVDPTLRRDLQTRFSAGWDGGRAATSSMHSADAITFGPAVLGSGEAATGEPWVAGYQRTAPLPPAGDPAR
ncbi:MAG TPA: hypothetical protein VIJ19_04390 [Opitutaceae bacterium]